MVRPGSLQMWALFSSATLSAFSVVPEAAAQEVSVPTFGVVIEPTVQLGLSTWRNQEDYEYYGDPGDGYRWELPPPDSHTPAAGFGLMVGARLGEHVQVGGYARLDYLGQPHVGSTNSRELVGSKDRAMMYALGGQLTLSAHAYTGFYFQFRTGRVFVVDRTPWSIGGAVGYGFHCRGAWYLGIAFESGLTLLRADPKDYDYDDDEYEWFLISNGLAAHLRYRGL